MKFKAVLAEPAAMKDFYNLIGTISRLAKETICCMTKDGMRILSEGDTIHGVPLCWITIDQSDFFTQYEMVGVDEEHNSIMVSFNPTKFSSALSMLKGNVNLVKIKLTKKQFPCLSVTIEVPSVNASANRQIVHDVPVMIVPVRDWPEYDTPKIPPCQISVSMPTLKSLKNLCDKMKNLSPSLTICCGLSGDLSFIVETDSAMVASRFFNLLVEKTNDKGAPPLDGDEVACNVDAKQLALCFTSNQFQSIRMTGTILQDEVFNIAFIVRPNVTMNCLIFAVAS